MSSSPGYREHRILSSMGSAAVLFAAYAGISVERISTETGIDPVLLMDPDSYLPETFFARFFHLLAEVFPERNIALELARIAPPSYFGAPGRLILRSQDVRTMLEMLSEHSDLLADRLRIETVDSDAETILRTHQPLSDLDGGMSAEIGIGTGVRIIRDCFGDEVLLRVQFRHKAKGPAAAYRNFFRVPVYFEADCNAVVFSTRKLDQANRRCRTELRSLLKQQLECLRQEFGLESAEGLADIRRAITCNALKGDYSVSGLARSMGMSISTLHRHLASLGTRAGRLLNEARYVNAMGLLADSRLSIDEVAYRLGFESDRGFRKAFRRWTGKTPTAARKEMRT